MKSLYKTVIVIWSELDPTDNYNLVDIASEASDGVMYCSKMSSKRIEDPNADKDWDDTEFFDDDYDDHDKEGDEYES